MESSASSQSSSSNWNLIAWHTKNLESLILPKDFPTELATPKYDIGTRCRWIPLSTPIDRGTIIGRVVVPSGSTGQQLQHWGWLYLVFLDPDSPSHSWVVAEWAEEDDIELLQMSEPNSTSANTLEDSE